MRLSSGFYRLVLFVCLQVVISIAVPADSSTNLYTPAEIKRNAQREALGLPLLRPRAEKHQELATESATRHEKRGQLPIVLPKDASFGHISVSTAAASGESKTFLGYLKFNTITLDKTSKGPNSATEFSVIEHGDFVDLIVPSERARMGISAGLYGTDLNDGSKNFHHLRLTRNSMEIDDVPLFDERTGSYLETAVFKLDPETKQLVAHWVNEDGYRVYFSADPSAFGDQVSPDVVELYLKWEGK
ncbi:hypothetical protein FISHEDRAFT_59310 [Fistulina hepatica ATCC 64428]|uniref:Uncharacterized protein n=1 Tax=Fistulina hepatica ATCC 64428 TaxID=1128425 RepID=A0A0D7AAL7_9AGAR|nr:hypothetical protein FISHEDRAFT_59310 [Fistulina hepatica ATCC 64428]